MPSGVAVAAAACLVLAGCSRATKPPRSTPAFESQLPPVGAPFADLAPSGPTRDPCKELLGVAELGYDDIPRGGAIELVPKPGRSRDEVIDAATRVEQAFLPGVRDEERGSCRIFGPHDEVNVHLVTTGDAPRLEFETFDAPSEGSVRGRVRGFVADHGR
ncbi:MAG TPA: hypothetical protein VHB21_02915 [Minicystis sp.]|nr:hypothetical protein [Minicystis sp.]